MLLIKAKGGLGNRLLSAASAIAYAEATARKWCLDWTDGIYAPVGVNAVTSLFENMTERDVGNAEISADIVPVIWKDRSRFSVRELISNEFPNSHSDPLVYRKLCAPLRREGPQKTVEVFWSYTSKYGRIKRYLPDEARALGRDRVLSSILTKHFQPIGEVAESVNSLLKGHHENVLGVHIRYTDLKVPIERLISVVKSQMRQFNYQSIYLATDSHEAETLFKQRFDDVITSRKRFAESNRQLHGLSNQSQALVDAKSALTDMIALANCRGLIYCSRSTFAETSRLMGHVESERLVDVDRFNPVIQLKRALQEYL